MFTAIFFITGAFLVLLVLRTWLPSLCAICLATGLTWLYGLFAGWNPVIIAMLMGGSAVGLMYYLKLERFKLPFLLTAFSVVYFVLLRTVELRIVIFLALLWLAFSVLRGNWLKKVVECCKNW